MIPERVFNQISLLIDIIDPTGVNFINVFARIFHTKFLPPKFQDQKPAS